MKTKRILFALLLGAAVSLQGGALTPALAGGSSTNIEKLTLKLKSGDFRMRVQAALVLGKTGDPRALRALLQSLQDESVAVRAASAAALGILGDPAALPSLRRAQDDSSAAVRRRITSTIENLEEKERTQLVRRRAAKVLVKFDSIESRTESVEAIGAAAQASRDVLSQLPDIAVLNPTEDPQTASKRHHRPVIMVRASVTNLSAKTQGADTVVSADVEFLVERFPERSIMGRLSGNASVKSVVQSSQDRTRLQEEAVGAAVSSALQSSGEALVAAAGRG